MAAPAFDQQLTTLYRECCQKAKTVLSGFILPASDYGSIRPRVDQFIPAMADIEKGFDLLLHVLEALDMGSRRIAVLGALSRCCLENLQKVLQEEALAGPLCTVFILYLRYIENWRERFGEPVIIIGRDLPLEVHTMCHGSDFSWSSSCPTTPYFVVKFRSSCVTEVERRKAVVTGNRVVEQKDSKNVYATLDLLAWELEPEPEKIGTRICFACRATSVPEASIR